MPETTKTNGRRRKRRGKASAWFRNLFAEEPALLDTKKNDEVRRRWLDVNPRHTEVPPKVLQSLANVKSQLRKKMQDEGTPLRTRSKATQYVSDATGMEALEEHIEECMKLARDLDRNGLREVRRHLRQARNQVSLKLL